MATPVASPGVQAALTLGPGCSLDTLVTVFPPALSLAGSLGHLFLLVPEPHEDSCSRVGHTADRS